MVLGVTKNGNKKSQVFLHKIMLDLYIIEKMQIILMGHGYYTSLLLYEKHYSKSLFFASSPYALEVEQYLTS